ncbi:MAG: hypothetical protein ACP5N7_03500 [Candidatus Pacearchaeota archaeon]
MKNTVVKFVEWGYNFTSEPMSEADATEMLRKLADKGITAAYKQSTE